MEERDAGLDALIMEIARLTGESKTEAVRRALEERRERLARQLPAFTRARRLRRFLEQEAWPAIPQSALGRALPRGAEDRILGYGGDGV